MLYNLRIMGWDLIGATRMEPSHGAFDQFHPSSDCRVGSCPAPLRSCPRRLPTQPAGCTARTTMRAVIQKVLHASVVVDGQTISSIGRGLMVLVGIGCGASALARSADSIVLRRAMSPAQTTHPQMRRC